MSLEEEGNIGSLEVAIIAQREIRQRGYETSALKTKLDLDKR